MSKPADDASSSVRADAERAAESAAAASGNDDETHAQLLDEMREAMDDARDLVSRTDESSFIQDRLMQRAAAAIFIQFGETANALDDDFKARNPAIDWRAAYVMRNKLAHHYAKADPQLLWASMTQIMARLDELVDLG